MKALILEDYMNFVYKEVDTPRPGMGEVLVRVKACAVCGSDVHGMDGSTGRRRPPIIMGHEASGVIEEVGGGVSRYQVGDRVTFDSTVYCNACENCAQGRVNLCEARQVLGVSCADYRRHGAFSEYVVVPAYILYPLPDEVTFIQSAMVEPLAIACHGLSRTGVLPGDSVLIAGVGTIGMLSLQVAKALGAGTLIAVDLDDKKLARAKELGAQGVFNYKDPSLYEKILGITKGGKGCDIALDATGIEDTVNLCISSMKLGGKVVLVGNLAPRVSFPLQQVVTREISLFGSCACAGEYAQSLQLIASDQVEVDSLVSKAVPLSEGSEWIHRVYNKEEGLNKIVLLP